MTWAHPRSRGENLQRLPEGEQKVGSSPLTRGKRRGIPARAGGGGLIPAHAGKTRRRFRRSYVMGAHPRSRGENGGCQVLSGFVLGSSPLTRGKPLQVLAHRVEGGLIPAHAGKTTIRSARSARPWAHPRSRGENTTTANPITSGSGSSPLTRGKLSDARLDRERGGLIPAHAGKT